MKVPSKNMTSVNQWLLISAIVFCPETPRYLLYLSPVLLHLFLCLQSETEAYMVINTVVMGKELLWWGGGMKSIAF
jgi:hypothetical protein